MLARLHRTIDRQQGEIGKMLVVDGVELVAFEQALQVRELTGHGAVRLEHDRKARDERVDRHVADLPDLQEAPAYPARHAGQRR